MSEGASGSEEAGTSDDAEKHPEGKAQSSE
jgi:hypothetical protein